MEKLKKNISFSYHEFIFKSDTDFVCPKKLSKDFSQIYS